MTYSDYFKEGEIFMETPLTLFIKKRMEELRIDRQFLIKQSGVSMAAVSRILNGITIPKRETIQKLSKVIGKIPYKVISSSYQIPIN